jgi:hypothetical protein
MANVLQVKRSAVPGRIPLTSDLALGEIAINTYDGKLFVKKAVSGVETIIEIGGGGGGIGYTPADIAGDTFTGKVNLAPSSSESAGLNIGAGSAPAIPQTGDLWGTNTALFYRGSAATYTIASLGLAQTWTGAQTFATLNASGAISFSTPTGSIDIGTSQTSGTLTLGGTGQTGTITLDRSTSTHTLNIASGAHGSGVTKTVNLATGGGNGSTTVLNVGTATSGATCTISLNGSVVFSDAITARSNLGLVLGQDVQPFDQDLSAIAGLAGTSGYLRKTAANTWTLDASLSLSSGDITGALGFTPANKAGDTLTGDLNIFNTAGVSRIRIGSDGAFQSLLQVSSASGQNRDIILATGGNARWIIRATSSAESGSNAGTDWQLLARDDSGGILKTVLSFTRATGVATFSDTPKVAANDILHAGNVKNVMGQALSGSGNIVQRYDRKTGNYTALAGDLLICDTSGGAFTVTLPASPAVGDIITIVDGGNFKTTPLTVARNGNLMQGETTDLTVDVAGVSVQLIWVGTTWRVFLSFGIG